MTALTPTPSPSTAAHRVRLDRALTEALGALVSRERIGAAEYVHLPLHHPDGSRVTVRIDLGPDGFHVGDDGITAALLDGLVTPLQFQETAVSVAEPLGLTGDRQGIRTVAGVDDLYRAICDVAQASWTLTDRLSNRPGPAQDEAYHRAVGDRLISLFGAARVTRQPSIIGSSGKVWRPSASLWIAEKAAIVQGVPAQSTGLYRAIAMFHDLSQCADPPPLFALCPTVEPEGQDVRMLTTLARVLPLNAAAGDFVP